MLSKRLFTDFSQHTLKNGRYLEQEAEKICRRHRNRKRRKEMTSLISDMLKLEYGLYLALVSEPVN